MRINSLNQGVNTISARSLYIFLIAAIVGLLSVASYHIAYTQFAQQAVNTSRERLTLYRASLRSTLERVSHLPRVARLHADTKKLLKGEFAADNLNLYLKEINDAAGSAAIYVLDAQANTLAASNFDTQESFVGNNYRFRRYYSDAIETGTGRFFAVGVTTGRPGYFMSEVIMDGGKPLGVAVVKVEFLDVLADWKTANENVLISDKDDVVVLASQYNHLYKTLRDMSPQRLSEMQESRKFSGFTLEPLDYKSDSQAFEGEVVFDGQRFIVTTVDTYGIGWKLHFLTPLDTVHKSAFVVAAIVFLIAGFALIGVLYMRSRHQQDRLKLVAAEAKRVGLVNTKLEIEIKERKKTEERLRDTQAELIQSSRLAALGKMSAAIVHEVNQPVSAIRMFTASGSLLVKEKRLDEATGVFQEIRKMTERLGAITSDLLIFSRKPVTKPNLCDLNESVKTILAQYTPELEEMGVKVTLELHNKPVMVRGSEVRFEQLVSNLLKNAMQASSKVPNAKISIATSCVDQKAGLTVKDEGEGIAPEIIDQLFDPFFTTKTIGKGVGLGLALCYAIADEASGRIHCENNTEAGATFYVEFPIGRKTTTKPSKELTNA